MAIQSPVLEVGASEPCHARSYGGEQLLGVGLSKAGVPSKPFAGPYILVVMPMSVHPHLMSVSSSLPCDW